MECMQAKALRPSLRGELTQQDLFEEVCHNTTTNAGVSLATGEDLFVDELLNLQNLEFEGGSFVELEEEEEEEKSSFSFDDELSNLSGGFSESPLTSELAVPDDDLAELEWVSHFVDDSFSEFSLLHPVTKQRTEVRPANRSEPELNRARTSLVSCYPSVPVKPRTKRARPATRQSLASQLSESSSSSSTISSASSLSFGFSSTSLLFANPVQLKKPAGEPERKKQKRKPGVQAGLGSAGPQFQRRCSHCQVQKTPQWRTGPLGAKTLCNACGVRFKSGRLYPEYRPACSPTFCSDVHSNSHRKVLEMRKKKEVGPGSGLTHVIPTC